MMDGSSAHGPFERVQQRLARDTKVAAKGRGRIIGSPGEVSALAARFEGLPAGIAHFRNLLEPLRYVGRRLPFKRAALKTLEALVDMSPTKPWKNGSDSQHPIVVVSNYELAARVNVHIRTVQFHLRWLAEAGVIARRPGPSGRRTRQVHSDKTETRFGIDLAPLVPFSMRMRAEAQTAKEHRSKMKRLQQQVFDACREAVLLRDAIAGLVDIETAGSSGAGDLSDAIDNARQSAAALGPAIESLAEEARRVMSADAAGSGIDQAACFVQMRGLADRATDSLAALKGAFFEATARADSDRCDDAQRVNPDSSMDESRFTKTHTDGLSPNGQYTGSTIVVRLTGGVRPGMDRENRSESNLEMADTARLTKQEPPVLGSVRPRVPDVELAVDRLLELDPELPKILHHVTGVARVTEARPQQIFDIARYIVIERFGGTQKIWGEHCHRMGPVVPSLAALLTFSKPDNSFRNGSRLAYWLGICRKPSPEINLVPSIFALLRKRSKAEASQSDKPDAPNTAILG